MTANQVFKWRLRPHPLMLFCPFHSEPAQTATGLLQTIGGGDGFELAYHRLQARKDHYAFRLLLSK